MEPSFFEWAQRQGLNPESMETKEKWEEYLLRQLTLEENKSYTIKLPGGGLVFVSHLRSIGTQVMVYEGGNENAPIGYINVREA